MLGKAMPSMSSESFTSFTKGQEGTTVPKVLYRAVSWQQLVPTEVWHVKRQGGAGCGPSVYQGFWS